jgi:hypothetical protein
VFYFSSVLFVYPKHGKINLIRLLEKPKHSEEKYKLVVNLGTSSITQKQNTVSIAKVQNL